MGSHAIKEHPLEIRRPFALHTSSVISNKLRRTSEIPGNKRHSNTARQCSTVCKVRERLDSLTDVNVWRTCSPGDDTCFHAYEHGSG